MEQWNILRRSCALTVQKCSQKFDACLELLLLLLLLLLLFVIKKSALSELEVLTEDTILHLLSYLHCSVIVEPSKYWSGPGDRTHDLPH